jgi:hypothetical protein
LVILDSLPRASPSARPRGSCPGSALQRGTSTRPTAWHLLPRSRVGNTERHTHPMGKAGCVPRGDLLWRAAVQRLPGNEPLAGIIGAEMRQGRIPEARTPSGPSSFEGSKWTRGASPLVCRHHLRFRGDHGPERERAPSATVADPNHLQLRPEISPPIPPPAGQDRKDSPTLITSDELSNRNLPGRVSKSIRVSALNTGSFFACSAHQSD